MRKRTHYKIRVLGFGDEAFTAQSTNFYDDPNATLYCVIRYGAPIYEPIWGNAVYFHPIRRAA